MSVLTTFSPSSPLAMRLLQIFFTLSILVIACRAAEDVYQLGVGIADVTGPAAEIGMVIIRIHA